MHAFGRWSVRLLVWSLVLGHAAAGEPIENRPRSYVIPIMKAPVLDGAIGADEWPTLSISRFIESAVPTQPMTPSTVLQARDGGVLLGSDGATLFIAYRSSVHPQYGPIFNGKRDPEKEAVRIGHDDSVEMWFDPAPDAPDSVSVQILGNWKGDTTAAFIPRGTAQNTRQWPLPGFHQAHGVTNGAWVAEYAIPLSSFGVTDTTKPFGVRLCRNFCAPWNQSRWEWGTTAFNDPATMCRIIVNPAAPIVRETGFYDAAGMRLGLDVTNATAQPVSYTVSLKGTVDTRPASKTFEERLAPGASKSYSLAEPIAAGKPGACEAFMDVTGKDGTPYFTRSARWTGMPQPLWKPVSLTRPTTETDIELAWNPVTKVLRYTLNYAGLPNCEAVSSIETQITAADGTVCGRESVPCGKPYRAERSMSLPQLAEGTYGLTVIWRAAGSEQAKKTLSFTHLDLLDTVAARMSAAPAADASATPTAQTGILQNGSFEASKDGLPDGWRQRIAAAAVVEGEAGTPDGTHCLKLPEKSRLSTIVTVKRSDAYQVRFWMKGTPGSTLRLRYSPIHRDWTDFTAGTEWNEFIALKRLTADANNTFTFEQLDGKGECFVDVVTVTPILNRLGAPFSSHMVLQRGKPIPIWGRTHLPNSPVTVTLGDATQTTRSDANGDWSVCFAARDSGGPYTLRVSDIAQELTDIVMGDVWICAGQSNMHFGVNNLNGQKADAPEVVAAANNANLRLLFIPAEPAATPQREHGMLIEAARDRGTWQRCTPESILLSKEPYAWRGFSAVGYFFGQTIQQAAGVPIGMIEIARGGTMAEAWTSPAGIAGLDNVPLKSANIAVSVHDAPSCLFNGGVSAVAPLPVKGIIWYQGESNAEYAVWYDRVFSNMIRDWRLQFRQGDIPFYFVQICAMDGYEPFAVNWPTLREKQLVVAESGMPNCAMAVSYDLEDETNPSDVHPLNKKDVAERLSRIALARDYGKTVVTSGPICREMKREGNALRLFFDHTDGGLVCRGPVLNGFRIVDTDGRYHDADARIDGQTVVVTAPGVANPAYVRYAFVQYVFPKPNLYNGAGLPASPFRTDAP